MRNSIITGIIMTTTITVFLPYVETLLHTLPLTVHKDYVSGRLDG